MLSNSVCWPNSGHSGTLKKMGLLAAEVPVQTEASEVKSLSRRAKCRCTPVLAPADIVATSTSVPGEGCAEDRVVSD